MQAGHAIAAAPLDVTAVAAGLGRSGDGALATFVGLVRDHNAGRRVLWLDYEAYQPLALKSFERIAAEAAAQWPDARVVPAPAAPGARHSRPVEGRAPLVHPRRGETGRNT